MDIELIALVGAMGGGAFGAAIGGQPAFIFTGFAVLVGCATALAGAKYDFLTNIAFGPVFGPHISFAGAVAACAYAARRGALDTGRDIATPLAGTARPDALLVGAVFGAGGYVVQKVLADVLEKSDGIAWTDTIALTVTISAFVVRFMFGRKGPLGEPTGEAVDRPRLTISSDAVWVRHQGEWRMTVAMGLTAGTLAAYAMTSIAGTSVDLATTVVTLGFGFSAVSLLFLQFDQPGPVTHHMTLPAAVAATTVLAAGGAPGLALALGAVAGLAGALVGELAARLFLIHGDTHIDPPAIAIFVLNTVILLVDQIV